MIHIGPIMSLRASYLYHEKGQSSFLPITFYLVLFECTVSMELCALGAFEDPDIIHVDDLVDPVRDLETISAELRLKVGLVYFFVFCPRDLDSYYPLLIG